MTGILDATHAVARVARRAPRLALWVMARALALGEPVAWASVAAAVGGTAAAVPEGRPA